MTKMGPWTSEPDEAKWSMHGLDCLAARGPDGEWCGYVMVPDDHPLHGMGYSDEASCLAGFAESQREPIGVCPPFGAILQAMSGSVTSSPECEIAVHGGINYAGTRFGRKSGWWFGFDCAHSGDLRPKCDDEVMHGDYRDLEYVKRECDRLARQLAAVSEHAARKKGGA